MPWIGTGIIVAGGTKRGNFSRPLAGLGMSVLADEANRRIEKEACISRYPTRLSGLNLCPTSF